jgi:hypothetical protein
MGGRYQKVQESLSKCCADALAALISEIEAILGALPTVLVESFTVDLLAGAAEPIAVSKGLPPDFGVLAEPKEANAPEPKPKALDAPVGEVNPPPGVVALRGPFFADEGASLAARLEKEGFLESEPLPPVDKESLLVLRDLVSGC